MSKSFNILRDSRTIIFLILSHVTSILASMHPTWSRWSAVRGAFDRFRERSRSSSFKYSGRAMNAIPLCNNVSMTPRVYRSIGKGKIQEEEIVSLQVRISPHLNHEGGSVNVFTQAECIVCGYYSCYKQFILWAYKLGKTSRKLPLCAWQTRRCGYKGLINVHLRVWLSVITWLAEGWTRV